MSPQVTRAVGMDFENGGCLYHRPLISFSVAASAERRLGHGNAPVNTAQEPDRVVSHVGPPLDSWGVMAFQFPIKYGLPF